jgi:hypothetical protein
MARKNPKQTKESVIRRKSFIIEFLGEVMA